MKIKELIERLSKFDKELDVYVFAEGKEYEPLALQLIGEVIDNVIISRFVEIGCGWYEAEVDEYLFPIIESLPIEE